MGEVDGAAAFRAALFAPCRCVVDHSVQQAPWIFTNVCRKCCADRDIAAYGVANTPHSQHIARTLVLQRSIRKGERPMAPEQLQALADAEEDDVRDRYQRRRRLATMVDDAARRAEVMSRLEAWLRYQRENPPAA
jgi:hypothetical protein